MKYPYYIIEDYKHFVRNLLRHRTDAQKCRDAIIPNGLFDACYADIMHYDGNICRCHHAFGVKLPELTVSTFWNFSNVTRLTRKLLATVAETCTVRSTSDGNVFSPDIGLVRRAVQAAEALYSGPVVVGFEAALILNVLAKHPKGTNLSFCSGNPWCVVADCDLFMALRGVLVEENVHV